MHPTPEPGPDFADAAMGANTATAETAKIVSIAVSLRMGFSMISRCGLGSLRLLPVIFLMWRKRLRVERHRGSGNADSNRRSGDCGQENTLCAGHDFPHLSDSGMLSLQ